MAGHDEHELGHLISGPARLYFAAPGGEWTEVGPGTEWVSEQNPELGVVTNRASSVRVDNEIARQEQLLAAINSPDLASMEFAVQPGSGFHALVEMHRRLVDRRRTQLTEATSSIPRVPPTERLRRWESAVDQGVFYNDTTDYRPGVISTLFLLDGPFVASADHWARTGEWPDDLEEYGYPLS